MKLRSRDDFKLTSVFKSKEELEDVFLFAKAAGIAVMMVGVKALSFLTRFFPFSLIGRDRSFHYAHKDIRKLMGDVTIASRQAGREFIVEAGFKDRYFYTIKGYFINSKKRLSTKSVMRNIEKSLKLPEGSVFVRKWERNKKQFLIPTDAKIQVL